MYGSSVELARRIYARAHLTGEFTLRSGAVSDEYFDKYLFESDPQLLREVAEALAMLLPPDVDALAGLELGGVGLATVCSQVSGLPTLFVRKRAKDYGTRRLAEGGRVDGRRLAVIEDVVTSGGQVLQSCREVREQGADIAAVLCVIDRERGGAEALAHEGLALRSVFTATDLERAAGEDPLTSADASLVELVEARRAHRPRRNVSRRGVGRLLSPLPLACGREKDFPAGVTSDEDKRELEREHCDPAVREPFIAALTRH